MNDIVSQEIVGTSKFPEFGCDTEIILINGEMLVRWIAFR